MAIVEVSDVRKRYGDKVAVDGVSFSIAEGEIFGVLGRNGAGKTTTVECLSGLRHPDGGTVRVAGFDPMAQHAEVANVLGVQLQESELPDKLTVREALRMYADFYPNPRDGIELADQLGLTDRLDARYRKLSGGQKQRLSIALALIGRPRVVILDELTTGLDPQARRDTWRLIEDVRDSGVTVLLVTHLMEEAQQLCDRVAVIDHGQVIALDSPLGLIRNGSTSTQMSFTPTRYLDLAQLREQPDVTAVNQDGERIVVSGSDASVSAILTLLARSDIGAERLRISDATLDDAFLNLVEDIRTTGAKR